jgi:stage V sporulation protein R
VTDVDLSGDRRLILSHQVFDGVLLDEASAHDVLCHAAQLWGYPVRLLERDAQTDQVLRTHDVDSGD